MAKNKNRKGGSQNRTPQSEQTHEQHGQRTSAESQDSPVSHIQGSPADVARRKQKSFGHN